MWSISLALNATSCLDPMIRIMSTQGRSVSIVFPLARNQAEWSDCHFHYSTKFAVKCTGCENAILKQFVEMNRNGRDECWHPECYMISKVSQLSRRQTSIDSAVLECPSGFQELQHPRKLRRVFGCFSSGDEPR